MLIAVVIGICVLLAILGFLVPSLSNHAKRGTDKGFGAGQRAGGKAPGPLGTLLSKSFGKSQRGRSCLSSSWEPARLAIKVRL